MPHLLTLQHLEKVPPTHPPLTEAPGSIPGGQTLALFPLRAPHPFPPEKNIERKQPSSVSVCMCVRGEGVAVQREETEPALSTPTAKVLEALSIIYTIPSTPMH